MYTCGQQCSHITSGSRTNVDYQKQWENGGWAWGHWTRIGFDNTWVVGGIALINESIRVWNGSDATLDLCFMLVFAPGFTCFGCQRYTWWYALLDIIIVNVLQYKADCVSDCKVGCVSDYYLSNKKYMTSSYSSSMLKSFCSPHNLFFCPHKFSAKMATKPYDGQIAFLRRILRVILWNKNGQVHLTHVFLLYIWNNTVPTFARNKP